jgi:hypothetical protein
MNPQDLYKTDGTGLMSAVVNLGGGTGEFVSADGLILTNHHVAFGAIQRASDKDHDYITNGFLAADRSGEIVAPGYVADVLVGYEDVTASIIRGLRTSMSYARRYRIIDRNKKRLIARRERGGTDIRCTISHIYGGNQYYLYTFKRLRDIRLVYAPPRDIGNFGGDVDNWMWPRHTGDFTFLRAYVSKDNVGADYSTDNVPYKPKSFLTIARRGVKPGDFTFVMGYPGRTYRNNTLKELQLAMEQMRDRKLLFQDIITFLEQAGNNDRAIQIKYAGKVRGLNNALKNYTGKLEGLEKVGVLKEKGRQEKQLIQWINASPARRQKYGSMMTDLENFLINYSAFTKQQDLIRRMINPYMGPALLSQAYTIYRTVSERQKPDMQREQGYQNRDLPRIKMRVRLADRGFHLQTDKAFFKFTLKKMMTLDPQTFPEALRNLLLQKSESAIDTFVDQLYSNTTLNDTAKRVSYLDLTPNRLRQLNDPLLQLASRLEQEAGVLRERNKAFTQEGLDRKKIYFQAILEKSGRIIAPDANSTIRFTYGPVKGYEPRDAVVYHPLTTLAGVIEKETGQFPFRVPARLKQLHQNKEFGAYGDETLKSVPTCFLNTTNVTGGNSGSPVLNANGEQVGIVFDMTYESVVGDYFLVPRLQRTISVDIRYVLFVTEKFSNATHIIKELGLQ